MSVIGRNLFPHWLYLPPNNELIAYSCNSVLKQTRNDYYGDDSDTIDNNLVKIHIQLSWQEKAATRGGQ